MKKLIKLFVLTIILFSISCQNSMKIINSSDDEEYIEIMKGITYYRGMVFDGIMYDDYENGNHKEEVYYEDGKKVKWIWYEENGSIIIEGIKVELFYDDDLGKSEGGVFEIIKDSLDIEFINYNKEPFNGRLFRYWEYKGKERETLHSDISVKNGYVEGKMYFYNRYGILNIETDVKKGKLNGLRKIFYENGNINEIQSYRNDKIDGERFVYWKNGKLKTKSIYKDGVFDGEVVEYYETGMIESKGNKKFDNEGKEIKIGEWTYFTLNDKLKYKEQFDNFGSIIVRTYFYENRNIKHKVFFNHSFSKYKSVDFDMDGNIIRGILF